MKTFLKALSKKINTLKKQVEKNTEKATAIQKEKVVPAPSSNTPAQRIELEISSTTIIKVLFIVAIFFALGGLVKEIQNILITAAITFFLAMGLTPIVSAIEKHRIPRPLAILILYILFLGVLAILFVSVVPILADQLSSIAQDLRNLLSSEDHQVRIPIIQGLLEQFNFFDAKQIETFIAGNLTTISRNLQSVAGSTFSILSGIFQGVFNFIFALVILFFILMERELIGKGILNFVPLKRRDYIQTRMLRVQQKMSAWFRGQLILMLSVGMAMYVGMKIFEYTFDMPYAATIGILAGFMELFPYIGVAITGILSGLIALNVSWILLLFVIGWMILVQFLEGNLLVPLVMEKVTGLPSVVIILALAIGGILGHAAGGVPLAIIAMILSIPVAASISIFVEEYSKRK